MISFRLNSDRRAIYFLCLNALRFVPYAYGLLRTHAELDPMIGDGYTWKEPLIDIEPVDLTVSKITDPTVLLASCYVWNHNQQIQIARRVKESYPEGRVVFGGPHVPNDSEPYLRENPFVDVLVHGEGEIALRDMLAAFLSSEPALDGIAGISFLSNGRYVNTTPGRQLPKDLPVPSPYLNGLFDAFLEDGRPNKIGLWETNRGCPYECTFCDWGVRTMNKLRRHDGDKIRQEIDYLAQHRMEDIYVTDCNFGIFERDLDIARMLVEAKQRYGYPKRVRIQFAKKSNETVFAVSKLLHDNDMLWGTTLSMQSVDTTVLKEINRKFLGLRNYRDLEARYTTAGIPTYTELILGLPLETRQSFVQGICTLFDIGIHEDIRVFELALLPNAPLSRPDQRETYGLETEMRPLRLAENGKVPEYVELVFGTRSMPREDMAYCLLFGEVIQALHNGGYTRFLARYLHDSGRMGYADFYTGLLDGLLAGDTAAARPFRRIQRLIDDFYRDPEMPQIHRILSQPDMLAFLDGYNPKRKGWPLWTYIWLAISEIRDTFYAGVSDVLVSQNIKMDEPLRDLMSYQQDLMLTLEYDPAVGKTVRADFNWYDYFFHGRPLEKASCTLHYGDKTMGISHRFELVKGDRTRFVRAAIGMSYPYSKFRHFFHQRDTTTRSLH